MKAALGLVMALSVLGLAGACNFDSTPPCASGSGNGICVGGTASSSGGSSSGGASSGGATMAKGGSASGGAPDNSCQIDGDCAWGEIDHEILKKTDCICLFGCPSLIQNQATIERRRAQYGALCTPGRDGQGQPCPIDDCIEPPPLRCLDGVCSR